VQQIAQAITPLLGEGDRQAAVRARYDWRGAGGNDRRDAHGGAHHGRNPGVKHSLEYSPREAPWFYGIYTVALAASGLFVASGVNLISLSVGVQVMNALLLPLVLGFLYLLARRLPLPHRLRGSYAVIVASRSCRDRRIRRLRGPRGCARLVRAARR
jgi:hypothetical protein